MTRSLIVLFWTPAGGKDAGARKGFEELPLLGKSAAAALLGSVARLKPTRVFLLEPDGARGFERRANPAGLKSLSCGQGRDVISSLKRALPLLRSKQTDRFDVLLVDLRFPLLTSSTLKSLCDRRRSQGLDVLALSASVRTPALAASWKVLSVLLSEDATSLSEDAGLAGLARTASRSGQKTACFALHRAEEAVSLDSPSSVRKIVGILRERKIRQVESRGAILLDPASLWLGLDVRIGRGTVVHPSVIIEGRSRIGRDCLIQSFVRLVDTRVGDRVRILSATVAEQSVIKDDAQIGPFTRFRPGTVIQPGARVGNFVEMKNTVFGRGSKANHLSYLGDAEIGADVNIGAGTITCNYDGVRKNRTRIEDGAFIGSGTELVAPVRVGRKAYIGAGSTITRDVSPEALAVARSRQIEKPGWAARKLKK